VYKYNHSKTVSTDLYYWVATVDYSGNESSPVFSYAINIPQYNPGAGFDADLLDGYHAVAFPRKDETATIISTWSFVSDASVSAIDLHASTWTQILSASSASAQAGLALRAKASSGNFAIGSIHVVPVADYRSGLVATYSGDGSGAGYFAINQFVPTSSATLERLRVNVDGKLLIGATAPVGDERVNINGRLRVGSFQSYNTGSAATLYGAENTGVETSLQLHQAGAASLRLGSKASDSNIYLTNDYGGAGLGNAATSITVSSVGLVGIGTTAPAGALDIRLANSVTTGLQVGGGTVGSFLTIHGNATTGGVSSIYTNFFLTEGDLVLGTWSNRTNQLYLKKDGNVGINTTAPTERLHVNGRIMVTSSGYTANPVGGVLGYYSGAGTPQTYIQAPSGGEVVIWNASTAQLAVFKDNGRFGIGTTSPSAELHIDKASGGASVASNIRVARDNYGMQLGGGINQGVGAYGTISTVSNGTATERIRLSHDGYVGIGTTSPGDKLEVAGNVFANAFNAIGSPSRYNAAGGTYMAGNAGSAYGEIRSYADAAGAVRFLSLNPTGGYVGIGTITPSAVLDVVGANTDGGLQYRTAVRTVGIGQSSGEAAIYWGSGTRLNFTSGGAISMSIQSSGKIGIGTNVPNGALTIYNTATFDARTSGINVHRPSSFGQFGSMAYDGDTTYFTSTYTGGGAGQGGAFVFLSYDNSSPVERFRIARGTGNVTFSSPSITAGGHTIWTSGNDGAGSGLDADLLDGYDSSAFARLNNHVTFADVTASRIFTQDNYTQSVLNPTMDMASWFGASTTTLSGIVTDRLAFTPPTTATWSTDGTNFSSITIPTSIFKGMISNQWGGFNIPSSVQKVRFTWSPIGYIFTDNFVAACSTNGNSIRFIFEKSETGATWLPYYTSGWASTWPGYITHKMTGTPSSTYPHFRITIERTATNANDVTIGGMSLMTDYGGSSPLYTWDASKIITFAATPTVNGSGIWHSSNDGAGSGLDADLLDGINSNAFMQLAGVQTASGRKTFSSSAGTSAGDIYANSYTNSALEIYNGDGNRAAYMSFHISGIAGVTWGLNTNAWLATNAAGIQINGNKVVHAGDFSNSNNLTPVAADTLAKNGISYVTGISILGQADGALYTQAYSTDWQHQIFGDYRTGQIAIRGKNGGTWQAWRTVWDSSNDGAGSGLDADLLDGNQAAAFTLKYVGLSDAVNLNTVTDSGFYRFGPTVTNGPSGYGGYSNMLVIRGSDTMSQIYMNYNDANMWWRSGSGVSDGAFASASAWRKMWNDANDGAGSGLDADLWDGYQFSSYLNQSVRTDASPTFVNVTATNFYGTLSGGSSFVASTRDAPDNALQYWQSSALGITEAPDGEWFNTIRMSHGDPLTYYSNTLAIRMTGAGVGDIYTQTIQNGTRQGWKKFWNDGNDGAGSGLDADLLDGYQSSMVATINTVAVRNAGGYLTANWFDSLGGGIYSSTSGSHWNLGSSGDGATLSTGSTVARIRLYTAGGIDRASVYADNGNYHGFLDSAGNWTLQMSNSSTAGIPIIRSHGTLGTIHNSVRNNQYDTVRGQAVGVYDPTNTQGIWAMGASYVLPAGGASTNYGSFYGLAWSYNPDYGGAGNNPQSKVGLGHQLLVQWGGTTQTAIGNGIWTNGNISGVEFYSGSGNYFRAQGTGGFYCETYNGGWNMTDGTWLRSIADKGILTGGAIQGATVTATSDLRLKSEIKPLTNFSKVIDATNVYSFIKDGTRQWGVIAQEVLNTPAALLVHEGGTKFHDGTPILTVDFAGFTYALLAEVKELRKRVALLEAK
jgi:hypothetical protein